MVAAPSPPHCGHGTCEPTAACKPSPQKDGTHVCQISDSKLPKPPSSGSGAPSDPASLQNRCLHDGAKAEAFITCDDKYKAQLQFQAGKCFATCNKDDKMMWILIAAVTGGSLLLLLILFVAMR